MAWTENVARVALSFAAMLLVTAPATAQIKTVDPNAAANTAAQAAAQSDTAALPGDRGYATTTPPATPTPTPSISTQNSSSATAPVQTGPVTAPTSPIATTTQPTYHKDDLMGAAEGVFGKGAAGLAGIIEKILKDQGEPNAYIDGREGSFAIAVGLRYGSGTMSHKIEGKRPVYWTGPSIGFDVGGDAAKVFTLVYNLYDTQELYRRYPQVEGRAYFVGGFSATYLRRGSVVLIPVRLGVGVRLGANVGYMKFSQKMRYLPF